MHKKVFPLLLAIALIFMVGSYAPTPVEAATTGWSGALGTDTVISFGDLASSTCIPETLPINIRNYHVQPFYVDTATTYDVTIIAASGMNVDPDATMHAIYTPSFSTADWSQNCIAYKGSLTVPSAISGIALSPGVQYYVVVMNTYFGTSPGATFSGEISSVTGTAYLGLLPATTPGIVVPNVGTVQISTTMAQPAYGDAAGSIAQIDGSDLYLPHDADGNGYDTYTVTAIELVGERVWVQIFLGSENFAWVPLDSVIPLTYLPEPSE